MSILGRFRDRRAQAKRDLYAGGRPNEKARAIHRRFDAGLNRG